MSSGPNTETVLTSRDLGEEAETPLSAQSLRTWVDRIDEPPSLMLDDGERVVEISTAIGSRVQAKERLIRLASTALALATELE